MNVIEYLIYINVILLLVLNLKKIKISSKQTFVVFCFSGIILYLHFVLNVVRWQFYPVYFVYLFLILLLYFKGYKNKQLMGLKSVLVNSLLGFFILLSIGLYFAFPMYDLPTPSGEFELGTTTYVIEDIDREEQYSDQEFRRFKIQIWYPAETVDGYIQAPWLEGGITVSRALAKDNGLPFFVLDHSSKIMSHSFYDAPLQESDTTFPVIIISHGWRGFSTLHTDFAEELASLGYIVVSIDHTYGSVATMFTEDDFAYLNLDALQPRDVNPDFLIDANLLVNTYAQDIISTIDYLEELNIDSNSMFYNTIDFDRLGLLGHSTGGGAGVQAALLDGRIDAVLGLDSWVEPIGVTDLSNGLEIPSLFLRSGQWETGENNSYLYTLIQNSVPSNLYQINGTTHFDFAMVYMYSSLTKFIGFSGSVDSSDLTFMLKDIITSYFDHTLKEEPIDLEIDSYDEIDEIIID